MTCTTHHFACECREAEFKKLLEENERLREEVDFLECLRAAGVDNWQGYDMAVALFNEGSSDHAD